MYGGRYELMPVRIRPGLMSISPLVIPNARSGGSVLSNEKRPNPLVPISNNRAVFN